ncbi:hypothetical protein SUGI_0335200 [Cryptomeria japonica]|nr:hypothetical protein SUGI_0335200 [Cryptomeria japonica]
MAKEEIKEQDPRESLITAKEKLELESQEVVKTKEEEEPKLCVRDTSIIANDVQESSFQSPGMEVIDPCKNDLQGMETIGPRDDDVQDISYAVVKNDLSKINPHMEELHVYQENSMMIYVKYMEVDQGTI